MRRRLPYQIVGGTRFYERREIKDVLAYLRLINNPADAVSLERIINVPNRGIGDTTLDQLRDWAAALGIPVPYTLKLLRELDQAHEQGTDRQASIAPPFGDRAKNQLVAFARLMSDLQEAGRTSGLVELFDMLLLRTGYREYLANDKAGEERWENVMELRSVVTDYAGMEPGAGLRAFLENASLVADVDSLKAEQDSITLLTLHSAKGLEYPVVFITGMEEGIFPHSRSQGDPEQMDEERRLCYVGMTRAMQRLYLVHCDVRTVYGTPRSGEPSQFLASVPMDRLHLVNSYGMQAHSLGGGQAAVRTWSGTGTTIGGQAGGRGGREGSGRPERKQFGSLEAIIQRTGIRHGSDFVQTASLTPQARPTAATVPPVRVPTRGNAAPAPVVAPAKAKYAAGQRVRHTSFGQGTVLASAITRRGEEEVRVRFDGVGEKTLLGALAPMEIVA